MSHQRTLAFVNEGARAAGAGMTVSQLRRELEKIFAEQARASLHAGAHLTLAVEALPQSPAVSRTRVSLGAVQAQLDRWDGGLQNLAGFCESMLSRVGEATVTGGTTHD